MSPSTSLNRSGATTPKAIYLGQSNSTAGKNRRPTVASSQSVPQLFLVLIPLPGPHSRVFDTPIRLLHLESRPRPPERLPFKPSSHIGLTKTKTRPDQYHTYATTMPSQVASPIPVATAGRRNISLGHLVTSEDLFASINETLASKTSQSPVLMIPNPTFQGSDYSVPNAPPPSPVGKLHHWPASLRR